MENKAGTVPGKCLQCEKDVVFPEVALRGGCAGGEGYPIFVASQGAQQPGDNQETVKQETIKEEEKTTEQGYGAVRGKKEKKYYSDTEEESGSEVFVFTKADHERIKKIEEEERAYDEEQTRLYHRGRGDYFYPEGFRDSSGDDMTPRYCHGGSQDEASMSMSQLSQQLSPRSNGGSPDRKEGPTTTTSDEDDQGSKSMVQKEGDMSLNVHEEELNSKENEESNLKGMSVDPITKEDLVSNFWDEESVTSKVAKTQRCQSCLTVGLEVLHPTNGDRCPTCVKRHSQGECGCGGATQHPWVWKKPNSGHEEEKPKLVDMEMNCIICEEQLTTEQIVAWTPAGLAHRQCLYKENKEGGALCGPCLLKGVQITKPRKGDICPFCVKRDLQHGTTDSVGTACALGLCSPKTTVFKPATSCTPCRDEMHTSSVTVVMGTAEEPTEEEVEKYFQPLPEDSEGDEEEEKEQQCNHCGTELGDIKGAVLTTEGPMHMKCAFSCGRMGTGRVWNVEEKAYYAYDRLKGKCFKETNEEDGSKTTIPYDPYDDSLTPDDITKAYERMAGEKTKGLSTKFCEVILPKQPGAMGEECWAYVVNTLEIGNIFQCDGEAYKLIRFLSKNAEVKGGAAVGQEVRSLNNAIVRRVDATEDQGGKREKGTWENCDVMVESENDLEKLKEEEKEGEPQGDDEEEKSIEGTEAPEEATGGMTMTYPHIRAGDLVDGPVSKGRYYVVSLGELGCDTECAAPEGGTVMRKMNEAFIRPFMDGPPPSWGAGGRPDMLEEAQLRVVLNASRLEGQGQTEEGQERGMVANNNEVAAPHDPWEDTGRAYRIHRNEPQGNMNDEGSNCHRYNIEEEAGGFWCKAGNCAPRKTVYWPNWNCSQCHRNLTRHNLNAKGYGKGEGKKGSYGPMRGPSTGVLCCFFSRFGHCREGDACTFDHRHLGRTQFGHGQPCDRMQPSHPGYPCRHHMQGGKGM